MLLQNPYVQGLGALMLAAVVVFGALAISSIRRRYNRQSQPALATSDPAEVRALAAAHTEANPVAKLFALGDFAPHSKIYIEGQTFTLTHSFVAPTAARGVGYLLFLNDGGARPFQLYAYFGEDGVPVFELTMLQAYDGPAPRVPEEGEFVTSIGGQLYYLSDSIVQQLFASYLLGNVTDKVGEQQIWCLEAVDSPSDEGGYLGPVQVRLLKWLPLEPYRGDPLSGYLWQGDTQRCLPEKIQLTP